MSNKPRVRVLLVALAVTLAASLLGAVQASAAAGPFCYHRAIGGQGKGELIKAQTPEQVFGGGGPQKFITKIAGAETEIESPFAQVKGVIYNNNLQCQVKIDLKYQTPKLVKPNLPGCNVTIGSGNSAKAVGHQVWSYNGLAKELEEQKQLQQKPVGILLPSELVEGSKELPKETYTTITFGASCGVLMGLKVEVRGSGGGTLKPEHIGEWATTTEIQSEGGEILQHFWNGKEMVGAKTGLTVGTEPAKYEGRAKMKTIGRQQGAPQEIALFES